MPVYSVRYVHKISPRDTDVGPNIQLPDGCFSDRKLLGKSLRDRKIMMCCASVRTFRVEGDKVIVFPQCPGLTTYWHSIVLSRIDADPVTLTQR
jgi:hypothetical protein